jgi:hypothetical protein
MPDYPTVIATSVIRSVNRGESHGGVYLVDLDSETHSKMLDWDDESISWEGRGGDRGLRGVAFYDGLVYLAAADEIFIYDKEFREVGRISNRYLNHTHEIYIYRDNLYITSTMYDSVLVYNLKSRELSRGICLRPKYLYGIYRNVKDAATKIKSSVSAGGRIGRLATKTKHTAQRIYSKRPRECVYTFDPCENRGPKPEDTIHINNVFADEKGIYISGSRSDRILRFSKDRATEAAKLPGGTHNAQPLVDGLFVANDTSQDRVIIFRADGTVESQFQIPHYENARLISSDLPDDHARQAFGRGLCTTQEGLIIGGSSPATISVYRRGSTKPEKTVNLTMDVRNSIHGLEVWPYDK